MMKILYLDSRLSGNDNSNETLGLIVPKSSFSINYNKFYLLCLSLASKVFLSSIAIVIGPTPPGTGVM